MYSRSVCRMEEKDVTRRYRMQVDDDRMAKRASKLTLASNGHGHDERGAVSNQPSHRPFFQFASDCSDSDGMRAVSHPTRAFIIIVACIKRCRHRRYTKLNHHTATSQNSTAWRLPFQSLHKLHRVSTMTRDSTHKIMQQVPSFPRISLIMPRFLLPKYNNNKHSINCSFPSNSPTYTTHHHVFIHDVRQKKKVCCMDHVPSEAMCI
jgi:hypothetical protein